VQWQVAEKNKQGRSNKTKGGDLREGNERERLEKLLLKEGGTSRKKRGRTRCKTKENMNSEKKSYRDSK